jgi:type IV secretory pathway VirB10-like protein
MTTSTAIVAVMIFAVFTAALLTAREDVPQSSEVTREELLASPIAVKQMSPRNTPPPVETKKPAAARTAAPTPQLPAASAPPLAASMSPVIEPERERTASATISGCLESDAGAFRLTDASGASAPTSRSWKSGFLKKRPAQIELADGVGTLNLRSHVGRRVAATGTLSDRVMKVDSVRVVGACG